MRGERIRNTTFPQEPDDKQVHRETTRSSHDVLQDRSLVLLDKVHVGYVVFRDVAKFLVEGVVDPHPAVGERDVRLCVHDVTTTENEGVSGLLGRGVVADCGHDGRGLHATPCGGRMARGGTCFVVRFEAYGVDDSGVLHESLSMALDGPHSVVWSRWSSLPRLNTSSASRRLLSRVRSVGGSCWGWLRGADDWCPITSGDCWRSG